jgi:hypothetical protein
MNQSDGFSQNDVSTKDVNHIAEYINTNSEKYKTTANTKKYIKQVGFVGSIPTVARHIFQACPFWIHSE